MHGDHGVGAEVEEGLEGFFGAGVDGSIAVGEVGADGEQRDLGVEAVGDFVEAVEVGGVAGVVERGGAGGGEDVAAEAAVGVGEHARAPVFGGGGGDGE